MEKVYSSCNKLINEVSKAIVGKNDVLTYVMAGILADGHMLIEDFPGLGKTLMAKTFAKTLGCTFRRMQFTPDLLPADILGTYVFEEKTTAFKLREGPIFTNILLADEINRAPPKTQAALLEAMQEKQVTMEGVTHKLPKPFIVFATQNPIEYEGTYPLPEAQIDRFMMRLKIGYPTRKDEEEIIKRRKDRKKDEVDVNTVTNPAKVVEMQKSLENVHVDNSIQKYIIEIVARTREEPRMIIGASPRGTLALFKLSRAFAILNKRDYVIPDDVKNVIIPALAHRMILKPESRIQGIKTDDILRKIMNEVPVPAL